MSRPALVRHSYALVRSWIRRGRRDGELMGEDELREATGGSRTEIREVLAQLSEEGLIHRRRRTGTRVDTRSVELSIDLPIAYTATPAEKYAQRTLREEQVPARSALAALFGSPEEEGFLMTDSVIVLGGTPLALRTSYWRGSESRRGSPAGQRGTDMAAMFRTAFGVELATCEARVEAVSASERLASQLQVSLGEPLLLREAVLRGADGVVHEVNFTYYASRRTSLGVTTGYLDAAK